MPLRTDAYPIIVVAHVAALIANECIAGQRGIMDGWAEIGPNKGRVVVTSLPPHVESDER